VGGILTEVAFHEGQDVAAGQILFRIDPRPLEASLRQAEATLARDIAQLESAARDAERYRTLVAKDFVTKSQADQADANAAAMRATVRSDSAAVEAAELNLAYSTIRAPIAGRTGSLLVRQGNLVRPGAGALVVINQLRPILVRFPVPQRDFLTLAAKSAGRKMTVTATTADSTPVAEPGVLTFVDNAVDSLTGTVSAKAEFANTKGTLWPGAYVRVDVQLDVLRGAITVPSQAVLTGQDGPYVYVIDNSDQARVRPIAVGRAVGLTTVIDSGLVAGERVVVDGQSRLVPGSKVDIQHSERDAK
jgi:multidrug efflux system membrane fusion protein